MTYLPPTVAELQAEVMSRTGRLLLDAGLYRPAPDGSVAMILYGLARGAMDTGMLLASSTVPTDAEIAALSSFAIERVLIWAEHHCLKLIVQGWYRVVQTHNDKPLSTDANYSGWLVEQKEGVKGRRDELKAELDVPFRDTVEPVFVAHGHRLGHGYSYFGRHLLDGCDSDPWIGCDPGLFPYGYRVWGCL